MEVDTTDSSRPPSRDSNGNKSDDGRIGDRPEGGSNAAEFARLYPSPTMHLQMPSTPRKYSMLPTPPNTAGILAGDGGYSPSKRPLYALGSVSPRTPSRQHASPHYKIHRRSIILPPPVHNHREGQIPGRPLESLSESFMRIRRCASVDTKLPSMSPDYKLPSLLTEKTEQDLAEAEIADENSSNVVSADFKAMETTIAGQDLSHRESVSEEQEEWAELRSPIPRRLTVQSLLT